MQQLFSFIRRLNSSRLFPTIWSFLTIALLCIPGKAIPGLGLFGIKHIDKLAHFILFGGFVLCWGIYSSGKIKSPRHWRLSLIIITLISSILGIIMEFVQVNFIPNRSFDNWDIVADLIGSLFVWQLLVRYGKRWNLLLG
jgi:hypothetical protein